MMNILLRNIGPIFILVVIVSANFLPEDSLTDDAEQLNREKRDNFIERILKTLPFFKNSFSSRYSPPPPSEESDDKFSDDSISFDLIEPDLPTIVSPAESVPSFLEHLPMSTPSFDTALSSTPILMNLSQVISATPTISIQQNTINSSLFTTIYKSFTMLQTKTILSTLSPQLSSISPSTRRTEGLVLGTSIPVLKSTPVKTSIKTVLPTAESHTSLPLATKSMIANTVAINPTPSLSLYSTPTPVAEMEQQIIELMMVKDPVLPDERGYAEVLAKVPSNGEEPEVKNVRFLYSQLFVPVMSGLFGALCITIVIMVIRCTKRKRLRKVRYYGGKPESALYRLDHMGLLSELSSDEE